MRFPFHEWLHRLQLLPLLCLLLSACAHAPGHDAAATEPASPALHEPGPPEAASAWQTTPERVVGRAMVVAAHPEAARAGGDILRRGGSALDAAIAMQMVLTLVEPQSSGIGGGAFLLHHDGRRLQAWDGRETAPRRAHANLFLQADGKPMPFGEAVVGGRAVGVPGVVAMLAAAHAQHGNLPWADLFQPAIQLARAGFVVSPRLAGLLAREKRLADDPQARAYFYDAQGRPWPAGHVLKNPRLAEVLDSIARQGPQAFYRGALAAKMAAKVAGHARNPGLMDEEDLAGYQPRLREPVCGIFLQVRVCGAPPPSSGGITVLQMLGILQRLHIERYGPNAHGLQPLAVHLFAEAGRLAYADRARFLADADYTPLPGGSPAALLQSNYLGERAAMVRQNSMGMALPGEPVNARFAQGDDASANAPSTTHLVAADRRGRVVSMTSSIERAFGAQIMVEGFLLNNQLTDFSFLPADGRGPVANRVEPGKRPRSAMAPTMVFDRASGELTMAVGSPGGPAIINYVAKVLVGVHAWGMDIQQAIELPNFGSRNGPTELESGGFDNAMVTALRQRRHLLVQGPQTSGLHGLQRLPDGRWLAGVDPRREGRAQAQ